MATAVVPKIVLTFNHASGAGYYAMARPGFDPDFILSLAHRTHGGNGRGVGRRSGSTGPNWPEARAAKGAPPPEVQSSVEAMRAD